MTDPRIIAFVLYIIGSLLFLAGSVVSLTSILVQR